MALRKRTTLSTRGRLGMCAAFIEPTGPRNLFSNGRFDPTSSCSHSLIVKVKVELNTEYTSKVGVVLNIYYHQYKILY